MPRKVWRCSVLVDRVECCAVVDVHHRRLSAEGRIARRSPPPAWVVPLVEASVDLALVRRAQEASTARAVAMPPKTACSQLGPINGIWTVTSTAMVHAATNTAVGAYGERRYAIQAATAAGTATVPKSQHPGQHSARQPQRQVVYRRRDDARDQLNRPAKPRELDDGLRRRRSVDTEWRTRADIAGDSIHSARQGPHGSDRSRHPCGMSRHRAKARASAGLWHSPLLDDGVDDAFGHIDDSVTDP